MSTHRRPSSWAYKFRWAGRQIVRSGYDTQRLAQAAELAHRRLLQVGRIAEADRLFRQRGGVTVGQILTDYLAARCPDRDGDPRPPAALAAETRNLETLRAWWGTKIAEHITNKDRDAYHAHRLGAVSRGTGHRTTELELTTLRNALHWAVESSALAKFPALTPRKFRTQADVSHARDVMPRSGDELHRIASFLLGWRPATEVYAWAVLLGALTGLRSGELRALRACPPWPDLAPTPPAGHWDAHWLRITRSKRGSNPKIRLDDPERPDILPLLNTVLAWKGANYPASQWLLPNTQGNDLETSAITRALQEAARHLGLPERQAHGLRAYYASVRLAQGHEREEIAGELGQRSGADLVRDVYGVDPDEFDTDRFKALAGTLTWRPNTPGRRPAWERFTAQPSNVIHL